MIEDYLFHLSECINIKTLNSNIIESMIKYVFGPIKLGPFKFSIYLILIVLLVPKKNSALSINPYSIQICLFDV